MITLIAAISYDNVIGINGQVPWNIPEDMKRFKEKTLDSPVIMGRRTYESLPEKFSPLPQRKNIVLSSSLKPQNRIYIARNMQKVFELTEDLDSYVIGGREIYELFLPHVNIMEITRVQGSFKGDTFFPSVKWKEWNLLEEEKKRSEDQKFSYSFLTYERI